MKTSTRRWIYSLFSSVIGGGSSAVVSGVTTMGFSPDKFNLNSADGLKHLLVLMCVNFIFSAVLSAFFYLKQAPLPPESETTFQTKPTDQTKP